MPHGAVTPAQPRCITSAFTAWEHLEADAKRWRQRAALREIDIEMLPVVLLAGAWVLAFTTSVDFEELTSRLV